MNTALILALVVVTAIAAYRFREWRDRIWAAWALWRTDSPAVPQTLDPRDPDSYQAYVNGRRFDEAHRVYTKQHGLPTDPETIAFWPPATPLDVWHNRDGSDRREQLRTAYLPPGEEPGE